MRARLFSMKDGLESGVRFEEVTKALVENGYDGWMSSEYEGQGDVDTFELVREQQAVIRRFAAKYAVN
jgi:sugar phosphate isomerase/epimerase